MATVITTLDSGIGGTLGGVKSWQRAATTLDSGIGGTLGGVKSWQRAATTLTGTPTGVTTTYYYRTTGGTRGSTTSVGAIPAGAIVERAVTA